jgi:hypothetical protein
MIAKAWRAQLDSDLSSYMRKKISDILENDQICYRENPNSLNDYKRQLAQKTDPLFDFLKTKFNINLKVWYEIAVEQQDKSVENIKPVLN